MTQNELMMMHTLCSELYHARDALEVASVEHNDAKALHDEIHRLEEKLAYLAKENAEHHDAMIKAQDERDDARRKLGALTLRVGFLEDYDAKHPKKSLETFKAAVKKCIDDNHIVMTEGGMAK